MRLGKLLSMGCLLTLLFVVPLQAQNVQWNQLNSSIKGSFQAKVLAADKQGYYVYQSSGKERVVEKYSYANNLIYSHKIPLEDRNIDIEELTIDADKAVVFFSIYSASLRKHGLFYQSLPHQGEASSPATLFDQEQIINRSRSAFRILPRSDLSGYSMLHTYEGSPESLEIDIRFVNRELAIEERTKLTLPQEKERYELRDVLHDDQHHLLLWFSVFDKEKRNSDPAKFYYKLVRVNRTDLALAAVDLRDTAYFLNSVQPVLDEQNKKIRLVGIFSERNRAGLAGVLLGGIPLRDFVLDSIGFSRFDLELKTKLLGYKNASKDKELADYIVKNVFLRSDGGALLLAESYYTSNQTYVQYSQGFPIYREIVYYHHDEILVLSINQNGTIDWRQVIPKSQISSQPSPYNSFLALVNTQQLQLVFNEEGRSKNAVVMYKIGLTGDVEPRVILSPEADDTSILPADAAVVGPGVALIPANKRKKKGMFRLTFAPL